MDLYVDTTTPTLDRDRTDQIRTFLAVTAAADMATTSANGPHRASSTRRRRLVGGVAAALVLGGGLFAANAVIGGPGPARTPRAVAVESNGGWTTIRLLDAQADPQAVVDQLEAAGIDARAVDAAHAAEAMEAQGFSIGFTRDHIRDDGTPAGPHHTSLSVSLPDPLPSIDHDLQGAAFEHAFTNILEENGVRLGGTSAEDTSVSIRTGSGRTVLVIAPA